MTVLVNKKALNLREQLAKLAGLRPQPQRETFFFDGDGSATDFTLAQGWKPVQVFVDGALFRPGSAEDYTVAFDGFVYTVTLAVAPATVDVAVVAEREV